MVPFKPSYKKQLWRYPCFSGNLEIDKFELGFIYKSDLRLSVAETKMKLSEFNNFIVRSPYCSNKCFRSRYRCKSEIVFYLDRLVDWLVNWLVDWLVDWLHDWLVDWLVDWLIDWLVDWLHDWLVDWLHDWQVDWLHDWLVDLLVDWFFVILIDWLLYCYIFNLGAEIIVCTPGRMIDMLAANSGKVSSYSLVLF